MVVKNEGVADIVSSLDDRLVVRQSLVANQSYSVTRKGLKKS